MWQFITIIFTNSKRYTFSDSVRDNNAIRHIRSVMNMVDGRFGSSERTDFKHLISFQLVEYQSLNLQLSLSSHVYEIGFSIFSCDYETNSSVSQEQIGYRCITVIYFKGINCSKVQFWELIVKTKYITFYIELWLTLPRRITCYCVVDNLSMINISLCI